MGEFVVIRPPSPPPPPPNFDERAHANAVATETLVVTGVAPGTVGVAVRTSVFREGSVDEVIVEEDENRRVCLEII